MDDMDKLEIMNAVSGLAEASRNFYLSLLDQGFNETQAMALTLTWLTGVIGGR